MKPIKALRPRLSLIRSEAGRPQVFRRKLAALSASKALALFTLLAIISVACAQQAPQAPAAAPTAASAPAAAPTTAPAAAPAAAPTTAPAAAGDDTIQVTWVGPLTGDIAEQGQGYLNGIKMAIDEWNAKGGVLGKQIVIKTEDDACDPKQAGTVSVKIADDPKNVAVLGHFCSGAMLAGGPAYAKVNLPVITLTTNQAITQQGWKNIFRPFPRDIVQGPAAVEYPMRKFGAKKFALINDKSAVTVGLTDTATEFITSNGGTITSTNAVEAKDLDYSAVLTKIIQAESPDVILFCANSNTSDGVATKQMRALGYKGLIAGCDGYLDPGYLKSAGEAANKKSDTEAVYFPFQVPPYTGPDAPKEVADFGAKYKALYNKEPFNVEVFGYDVGNILVNTLTTAGTTDHQKVIDTLHNLGTKGVLIPEYKFDEFGDVTGAPMFIYTVNGEGKFELVEVWRAPE